MARKLEPEAAYRRVARANEPQPARRQLAGAGAGANEAPSRRFADFRLPSRRPAPKLPQRWVAGANEADFRPPARPPKPPQKWAAGANEALSRRFADSRRWRAFRHQSRLRGGRRRQRGAAPLIRRFSGGSAPSATEAAYRGGAGQQGAAPLICGLRFPLHREVAGANELLRRFPAASAPSARGRQRQRGAAPLIRRFSAPARRSPPKPPIEGSPAPTRR